MLAMPMLDTYSSLPCVCLGAWGKEHGRNGEQTIGGVVAVLQRQAFWALLNSSLSNLEPDLIISSHLGPLAHMSKFLKR